MPNRSTLSVARVMPSCCGPKMGDGFEPATLRRSGAPDQGSRYAPDCGIDAKVTAANLDHRAYGAQGVRLVVAAYDTIRNKLGITARRPAVDLSASRSAWRDDGLPQRRRRIEQKAIRP